VKKSKGGISAGLLRQVSQLSFLAFAVVYFITYRPSPKVLLLPILAVMVITVIFRTGFCGWLCPLGTIFDLFRKISKTIGNLPLIKPLNRRYRKWIRGNRSWLNTVDKYAKFFKYVFLIWMVSAAFLIEGDQHDSLNLPLIFAIVIIASFLIDRAWCRYGCPLGALLGIVSKLSPTSVTRYEASCINCNLCTKACPLNIDVANERRVTSKDCNTCLECINICPVDEALKLTIRKTQIPRYIYGLIVVILFIAGLAIVAGPGQIFANL